MHYMHNSSVANMRMNAPLQHRRMVSHAHGWAVGLRPLLLLQSCQPDH